jgi:uncharacterized protein YndB with AHSA1/START domain
MPQITVEAQIAAPPAKLFALSQDYYLRRAWDQFTRRIEFLEGARAAGLGVRARGTSWHGLAMEIEYISFKPPHQAAMKMLKGPWFFSHFAGTWTFEPKPDDSSHVVFRYTYKIREHGLASLLKPIVHWVFQRDVRLRLCGLKKAVEQDRVLDRLESSQ